MEIIQAKRQRKKQTKEKANRTTESVRLYQMVKHTCNQCPRSRGENVSVKIFEELVFKYFTNFVKYMDSKCNIFSKTKTTHTMSTPYLGTSQTNYRNPKKRKRNIERNRRIMAHYIL